VGSTGPEEVGPVGGAKRVRACFACLRELGPLRSRIRENPVAPRDLRSLTTSATFQDLKSLTTSATFQEIRLRSSFKLEGLTRPRGNRFALTTEEQVIS
jgi:hypothetical protein